MQTKRWVIGHKGTGMRKGMLEVRDTSQVETFIRGEGRQPRSEEGWQRQTASKALYKSSG
jgi:hypothetical protein